MPSTTGTFKVLAVQVDALEVTEQSSGSAPDFVVSWDEDGQVLRTVWASGSVCTGDAARRSTAAMRDLDRGHVPLLVDMRAMKRLEREAREHYKIDKAGVTAMALLVGSPVTKMLANFFMRTDIDGTPTRMFTSERAALAWLQEKSPDSR